MFLGPLHFGKDLVHIVHTTNNPKFPKVEFQCICNHLVFLDDITPKVMTGSSRSFKHVGPGQRIK